MMKTNKIFTRVYFRFLYFLKKIKKIIIIVNIMNLLIFISAMSCFSNDKKIIIPGKGINGLNFKTKYKNIEEISKKYEEKDVYLTIKNGKITLIVITNPEFTTKEGIKVGLTKNKLIEIYGKPIAETKLYLTKSNRIIGTIGDLIVYKGIRFVIDNDIIIGIIIVEGDDD